MPIPWITILGLLGVAVFLPLFFIARRGRRVGDHPVCAACAHTLDPDQTAAPCPECGSTGAPLRGSLRRCRPLAIVAALLTATAVTAALWPVLAPRLPASAADIYRYFPDVLLATLVEQGSPDALQEASRRLAENALSTSATRSIADAVLADRPADKPSTDAAAGVFLLIAHDADLLTPDQSAAFFQRMIQTEIEHRPLFEPGGSLPVQLVIRSDPITPPMVRGDSPLADAFRRAEENLDRTHRMSYRIDRTDTPDPRHSMSRDPIPMHYTHISQFNLADPSTNNLDFAITFEITITRDDQPLTTWKRTRTGTASRAAPGQQIIPIHRSPADTQELLNSVGILEVRVEPPPAVITANTPRRQRIATVVIVSTAHRPHALFGTLHLRTADGLIETETRALQHPLLFANEDAAYIGLPQRRAIYANLDGPAAQDALADWRRLWDALRVDIILNSEPATAHLDLHLTSVVDAGLLFRNVPVTRPPPRPGERSSPIPESLLVNPEPLHATP
jgi:predicted RNA-binding Zn-ribbon protein involved in translation (DUF1610 family)